MLMKINILGVKKFYHKKYKTSFAVEENLFFLRNFFFIIIINKICTNLITIK